MGKSFRAKINHNGKIKHDYYKRQRPTAMQMLLTAYSLTISFNLSPSQLVLQSIHD
jgi:hypothetical protein